MEKGDTLQPAIIEGTCQTIRNRYAGLIACAQAKDFGALDRDVVVIDTETTGFSLNHDELIQIAAARMDKGRISEWFVCFVNPGHPIPEDITHLTGICDKDVADAPDPEEARARLVAFVGDSDLVAHNADFDFSFITKSIAGEPLKKNTWIDSLDLARIALPRLKSHRLLDLVHTFKAPLSTHRADADVEALCVVYRILLAAVATMPHSLLKAIADMAEAQEWPTVKVFRHFADNPLSGEEGFLPAKEEEGGAFAPSSPRNTHLGQEASLDDRPFSLRSLRQARVGRLSLKARPDADAMAADPQKPLTFPSSQEIVAAFDRGGLIGKLYHHYELRTEQVQMSEWVLKAYASSTNLAVEAGTGVGKSMAYLLPSALVAKRNGVTVGVATKTNALLDQLVFKELPLLSRAMPDKPLEVVALKGFSHYPCLRQINRLAQSIGKESFAPQQAPALAALLSYVEQSEYDDIDALKIDYRALPRYTITTSSNECLRRKCPFYGALCFVHGARRRAEAADIVVTNHSLLFCDLMAERSLLPPIRYWVIDEAHGAEAEARDAFSLVLSGDETLRLARRVASSEAAHNVFVRAERQAGNALDNATLLFALTTKARAAGLDFEEALKDFLSHIRDLAFFNSGKKNKGYENVELWINEDIRASQTFKALAGFGRVLCDKTNALIRAAQDVVAILEGAEEAAEVQREIATTAIALKDLLNTAETILFTAPPQYVYSATFSKKQDRTTEKLEAVLVNVGEALNETLFATTHSVVFTSATLTVADKFDSLEAALGLNESEGSRTASCQLRSSYDFDKNMTIYVANDIPEPNDPTYLAALQRLLVLVHRAQQGSLLTLFTNRKEMESCFDFVSAALKEDGLRVVCQKWGVSSKGLRDDFLADEKLSLFALKSFWEGFDAPGATLRGVVIPKLPFAKPTDPLSCERALHDSQAWAHYVLPAAVLETKQAAGRLIRKADDKGVLILADQRLLTKSYGKVFLKSMPSRTIKVCPSADIAKELAEQLPKASKGSSGKGYASNMRRHAHGQGAGEDAADGSPADAPAGSPADKDTPDGSPAGAWDGSPDDICGNKQDKTQDSTRQLS
ncbi:MAG: DNA polymerase III subunit epsilon [Coriobacteriaceae bacterium]|nr:DNA polymerase III subunit epsilon [Coriobacteriaceae bacterium]